MRRQFLEEFRVRLDGCQYLRRQSGRVTASGFPALDGVEAGSQHFRHLALRYVQLRPDGFHVCQLVTGDAAGSLTPFLISTASSSDAFSSSKTHVTPRLSVVGSASSARLFRVRQAVFGAFRVGHHQIHHLGGGQKVNHPHAAAFSLLPVAILILRSPPVF